MKKRMNINNKITAFLFFILAAPFYFGQTNIPVIKSPQTYTIEKFGNIPVSLNTGSVAYDVDLFSYGDLYDGNNYNIGLRYYGTGFIPAKKSNYVGLDWSLDIGGSISREVRGLPDDFFSDWPQSSNKLYGHLEGVKTSNKTNSDIYNQNYNMLSNGNGGIGIKTGADSFEIEPDKFNFNFMGNNGYFFIGNDMKPIIISDNKNLKIDISQLSSKQPLHPVLTNGSKCLTKPTTIIITDEKGIKYYFGGNYENLEISYNLLSENVSENGFTITSWNLFKIEYPNSNILEIKYRIAVPNTADRNFCRSNTGSIMNLQEPFLLMFDHNVVFKQEINSTNSNYNTSSGNLLYDGTIYWGNTSSSSNSATTSYSATKKSLPSSVLLNGKTIVTFDFERYDKYLTSTIPSLKLESISFYNTAGTKVIKEINLDYYRYKDYFFLDKIRMFRKEPLSLDFLQEYNFDYYNKNTLPDENTGLIDYWGYYNNRPRMNMIPNFTLNKNTGDYTITDNTRDPEPALCSMALLKTIIYPTKGKSEFIYEPHKYNDKIDRNSASQFKNILVPYEGSVGGGRISKIINYSNDGSQIGTKEYKYISNYSPSGPNIKSSGILSNYYRNLIYVKTQTSSSTYEELNAYSDNFIETAMNSFPVQYSEVTEIENNKGFTKYYFTDYKMYPDSPEYKSVDNNLSGINVNYYPANIGNINLPYRSNNYKRGKLYKQEIYDQDFTKLKSSNTEFIDISEIIPTNFVTYVADRLRTKYFFKLFGGSFSPSKTIKDDILNNNLITSKSEYFYQSGNGLNLSKLKNTDTDGKIIETTYQYAHEKGNQLMIDKNMIGIPMETLTTQTIGSTTKTLSKVETVYPTSLPTVTTGGLVLPTSVISYDLQNTTASSTEVMYDKYDSKGNVQQYTMKDGVVITIIWGYDQTQPIAKIEGAKLSDIQQSLIDSIVSTSNTDASQGTNSSEQALVAALDAFRSNSTLSGYQITTYTYDPLIGVKSITPPSGLREVYIYDIFNRLKEIRENSLTGNILKEFKYNYKQ
ncbi:hypothetical protein HNP38_001697 [Chryseobacterium defluvii]|uniref:YD repeat-containing protein n=1 Tax=Chryseobacterium defluvii TaxID=160396 RepID=A0A840KD33_9FLAO|nr:hypothetical protein [Chryseobacterium defluvii]MBB4806425.1 hypothetical protein [Chryseobacterium defluvii]